MIFSKKGRLRKDFDEKFIMQLERLKSDWRQQKSLLDKSFDPSEEVICQAKLVEAKYFFLIKEAKHRKISFKR